ncbi:hypothetical protein NDU88_006301 [Pleurodeles waltl]|uniref:Uncharacterized protein n=1 Tax=Pleurodeles waltl TaxID=8319 RepID=A0AAV7L729_PLEWA|nr:hypothetical protein NDU88_006301 [Pleurodeles waltl]
MGTPGSETVSGGHLLDASWYHRRGLVGARVLRVLRRSKVVTSWMPAGTTAEGSWVHGWSPLGCRLVPAQRARGCTGTPGTETVSGGHLLDAGWYQRRGLVGARVLRVVRRSQVVTSWMPAGTTAEGSWVHGYSG